MSITDVWAWLSTHLGYFGVSFAQWIQSTATIAGKFFWQIYFFFTEHIPRILWLIYDGFAGYGWDILGIYSRIRLAFDTWWTRTLRFIKDWYYAAIDYFDLWRFKLRTFALHWWARANELYETLWSRIGKVLREWWSLVYKWFNDWCRFFVDLFEEHKEKIIYCLTEGWPRVWWFVYTRFTLIFQDFENHIEGWTIFISDPAQAIWDWLEPRAQELVADFLARLW